MAAALRGRADASVCMEHFDAALADANRALAIAPDPGRPRPLAPRGTRRISDQQALARKGDASGAKSAAEMAYRELSSALGARGQAALLAPDSPLHRAPCLRPAGARRPLRQNPSFCDLRRERRGSRPDNPRVGTLAAVDDH